MVQRAQIILVNLSHDLIEDNVNKYFPCPRSDKCLLMLVQGDVCWFYAKDKEVPKEGEKRSSPKLQ